MRKHGNPVVQAGWTIGFAECEWTGLAAVSGRDKGAVLEVDWDRNVRGLMRHIKKQRIYLELH